MHAGTARQRLLEGRASPIKPRPKPPWSCPHGRLAAGPSQRHGAPIL